MHKFTQVLTSFLNKFLAGRLVLSYYLLQKNFLSKSGWTKSILLRQPTNQSRQPIPWFTYSFIYFFEQRIKPSFKIFEFGSGNSTIWLSSFGCSISSVEHDENWFRFLKPRFAKIPNIKSSLKVLEDGSYAHSILEDNRTFDIVIIDGRDRIQCCRNSLLALKSNGVIIWDNSERKEYSEGYEFLEKNGFKRLDFRGLGPINSKAWCTSVFYRKDNCLEI